jgi:hypothetical protein
MASLQELLTALKLQRLPMALKLEELLTALKLQGLPTYKNYLQHYYRNYLQH